MKKLLPLDSYSKEEQMMIKKSLIIAIRQHDGQYRKSGEPYINHPIEVANILIQNGADYETVSAGLLHDVIEDTDMTLKKLSEETNPTIAYLVNGVTKIATLNSNKASMEATLKKEIIYLIKDIRIIQIKLADRTHNMRTLEFMSKEKQQEKAEETLNVYSPLAREIGAFRIKKELEELAFSYVDPDYYQIVKEERETLVNKYSQKLNSVLYHITELLATRKIANDMKIQFKSIYELYEDIKKNQSFDINDALKLKIVTDSVGHCYEILGIINSCYKVKGSLKDYISNPKPNGYQSLHSTIFIGNGDILLTKIRTQEMEHTATYGLSYSQYKKERAQDLALYIGNIRKEYKNDGLFIEKIQNELFADKVLVYTKDGQRKEFPKNSTIVDFAYSIHSELGNHMTGAIVNGNVESLNYILNEGDCIEIIVNYNRISPSINWTDYAYTTYAKNEINQSLKRIRRDI